MPSTVSDPRTERRLSATDRATVAYALAVSVAVAWRWPGRVGWAILSAHALLAALALAAPRARAAGRAGALLGECYPLLVVTALYSAVGLVNAAHGVAYDALVQRWAAALFGTQPSREWMAAAPAPWLSWLLHAGYLAYYPVVVGTPLTLVLSGRRAGARRALTAMMAAFYVCYVIELVFPVAGPRYAFPAADAAAHTAAARLAHGVLDVFAAWGTAFPSAHVAVCVAATFAALREWRALGAVLAVASVLLTLGTVYGQFHYVVDTLAGVAVGAAVARRPVAAREAGTIPAAMASTASPGARA